MTGTYSIGTSKTKCFWVRFPPYRCPRCDLKTRRPRETYVALYDRVCEEIAGMGLII